MDDILLEADKAEKENNKLFFKKMQSQMAYKSDYSGDLVSFDWVDEIENACPYIDIIVRNPKFALTTEENIVKVEKAKKITVASVKDLARHTENINKVNKNKEVKLKKILDVRNEETYNIYENRFLYTLINQMLRFVLKKEELLDNFELSDHKALEYAANTENSEEKLNIEVKITSEVLPSAKVDKRIKEEIKNAKQRIKRIKQYISNWERSEMIKALEKAHVPFINPPIKKTNIILKNPNFRIAVGLWEFLNSYDYQNNEDQRENIDDDANDILKGFLDHSFLIDYLVLDSMVPSKREQKKKMANHAILLLTEEVKRIVDLLLSCGYEITDEELLKLIAKQIKEDNPNRLVGADDVKKKFKNAMEEYLERTQEYL